MSYIASWKYSPENIYSFIYAPSVLEQVKNIGIKSIRFSGLELDTEVTLWVTFKIKLNFPEFFGFSYPAYSTFEVDLSNHYTGLKRDILTQLVTAANAQLSNFRSQLSLYLSQLFVESGNTGNIDTFVSKSQSLFYGLYFYVSDKGIQFQCNLPAHFNVYSKGLIQNYIYIELSIPDFNYDYISGPQYGSVSEITMRYDYLTVQTTDINRVINAVFAISAANSLRAYGDNVSQLWIENGLTFVVQETIIDVWPLYQNPDKILVMTDFSLINTSVVLIGDKYSEINVLDSFVPESLTMDVYSYRPNPIHKKKIESLKDSFVLKFYKYNGQTLEPFIFGDVDLEILF